MQSNESRWTLVFADYDRFKRDFERLEAHKQDALRAAIEELLLTHGIGLAAENWLKPIGKGIWEFRIGPSIAALYSRAGINRPITAHQSKLLLRLFVAFEGNRIIVVMHFYDKAARDSLTEQNRQIEAARKLLRQWKKQK